MRLFSDKHTHTHTHTHTDNIPSPTRITTPHTSNLIVCGYPHENALIHSAVNSMKPTHLGCRCTERTREMIWSSTGDCVRWSWHECTCVPPPMNASIRNGWMTLRTHVCDECDRYTPDEAFMSFTCLVEWKKPSRRSRFSCADVVFLPIFARAGLTLEVGATRRTRKSHSAWWASSHTVNAQAAKGTRSGVISDVRCTFCTYGVVVR